MIDPLLRLPENCNPAVVHDHEFLRYSQGGVFLRLTAEDYLETIRQLEWLDLQSYHRLSCAMGRCLRNDEKTEPVSHELMVEYLGIVWERTWRKMVMKQ